MNTELISDVAARAAVHAALADPARLQIIDTLGAGDTSPSELATMLAMSGRPNPAVVAVAAGDAADA